MPFRSRPLALLVGLAVLCGAGVGPLAGQKAKDIHDPTNAIANLDVHPDLQATLFAAEPQLTNPTNLDVDHRGRVWICDVKNYRGNNGKRPEGDRILILEDTDGDGKADKVKTFYQGRDVDSAMGICVLGNKVIVSCSPNVLVFTFDENDAVTKKEVLFTKTGQAQHDHSAHTFNFGPDGRLYWNFGNTGQAVHDKHGKPVVDRAGNVVRDGGQPYRQGMAFRCDLDGSNFEVLGHNFRNNYELTVDSFGTVWQSDNDDDGNRGVRINYVMEFGNFGYTDEMTGAGWNTKRTNQESDTPFRHWHLNDPGVVPNLLQTGGGSPAGICIYEGNLLPPVFRNQLIHCDPGPSIVRAYPVVPAGAGYKVTQTVNVLDGQKKNNWFRPADVCVAPDGSIVVTDWYDPGVGGHGQRDLDRGRIFRAAPKDAKLTLPKFDFSTAEGAAEALKNPNSATRYLAWTALHEMGAKAEPALLKLWQSEVPHERARALWLLGRIEGKEGHYIDLALKDNEENLRIVGLRLARQLGRDMLPLLETLGHERSPAVLREAAIALRHHQSPEAASLWAKLAHRHNGEDRWYLEALGIGADKNWDSYLTAYLQLAGQHLDNKAFRDIVWRSRAERTPVLLAKLIEARTTPTNELPRLFRAFDFQKASPARDALLAALAFGEHDKARGNLIVVEALSRVKNLDVKNSPQLAGPLNRMLDRTQGTPTYVEFVGRFQVADRYPDLLALAQKHPGEQLGVDATRMLLERGQTKLLQEALVDTDKQKALSTVQALASASDGRGTALLLPIVQDAKQDLELRRQATRALAKNKNGAEQLVKLAHANKLGDALKFAAGSALHTVPWNDVRAQAVKLFPVPAGKDNRPLPSIAQLAQMRGNLDKGKLVFAKTGTCANCHAINGEGKEVGPNLSEIGKKLSKEALFESILYPSASIAHNYETYVVETTNGNVAQGILVSQTPQEVTLKGADALVRTFPRAEVAALTRSPVSLMPADLHLPLSTQDLADMVEYLQAQKEAKTPRR